VSFWGRRFMGLLRILARWVEGFNRALYWVSAVAILVSSLILTYEVLMRYVFKIPTIWEIESAIYLGVMATFLGSAYGLKDGAHINIDVVVRALSPSTRRRLEVVTSLMALVFTAYVAYKGWALFWEAFSKGWRSESLWGPPLAIPYLFLPLGMSMLSLQFVIQILGLGTGQAAAHGSGSQA
jgi:TRAP-type C4-dicarboxylate transport system permease small subunit